MISTLEQLKIDEGLSLKLYKCTSDKWSIGYGRNLEDNPLTIEEAEYLLKSDLEKVSRECAKLPYYSELDPHRRSVILNMVFNMGMRRFKGFKEMNKALSARNYELATIELLDSDAARKLPERYGRLAKIMRFG
jgi:lysozyme